MILAGHFIDRHPLSHLREATKGGRIAFCKEAQIA